MKCCKNCKYFEFDEKVSKIQRGNAGWCQGAMERARKVVSFAIDLSESFVFEWGGTACPCFEAKTRVRNRSLNAHA